MNLSDNSGYCHVYDPELASLIDAEENRQRQTVSLIPSENFASPLSTELEGCAFANKNAEGYPAKRFVSGCEYADRVENLAIDRLKTLFGCEHANVQAMSATIANVALLQTFLRPGDTILSMELAHGGHLSHGASFHTSGKLYNTVSYGVGSTDEIIDMDQVRKLAEETKPALIICGASSYPRLLDFEAFSDIAKSVGALLLADMSHIIGLIAAGVIPSPVPYADIVTTSTHKSWRGPRGSSVIMCKSEHARKVDRAVFPGVQGAPKMDMIAARATFFLETMSPEFRNYAIQMLSNAIAFAQALEVQGFRLVSGGTDTHLVLVDVRPLGLSGAEAQTILEKVGITTNRNPIPFDTLPPNVTGGLRLGSPAMTTRGWRESEFERIAYLMAHTLRNRDDASVLAQVSAEVQSLIGDLPLFDPIWLPKASGDIANTLTGGGAQS